MITIVKYNIVNFEKYSKKVAKLQEKLTKENADVLFFKQKIPVSLSSTISIDQEVLAKILLANKLYLKLARTLP